MAKKTKSKLKPKAKKAAKPAKKTALKAKSASKPKAKAKSAKTATKKPAAKSAAKSATKAAPKAAAKKQKLETISFSELAQLKLNNDLSGVAVNHGPELHKHKSKGKAAPTDRAADANLRAKTSITGRKGSIAQPGRDDIGNRGH